jgi:hypothetical protein
LCCRLQQKRQEWARKGHGEYNEVEEKEFFKVRADHRHIVCLRLPPPPGIASCCSAHRLPSMALQSTVQEIKGEERMVCHFYRNTLPCQVLDKHLAVLAAKHLETKFIRVHAEKAPFLTGAAWLQEGGPLQIEAAAICHSAPPSPDPPHATDRGIEPPAPCPMPFNAERLKIWMLPTLAIIKHEKTTDYVVGLDELGGAEDFSTGAHGWASYAAPKLLVFAARRWYCHELGTD